MVYSQRQYSSRGSRREGAGRNQTGSYENSRLTNGQPSYGSFSSQDPRQFYGHGTWTGDVTDPPYFDYEPEDAQINDPYPQHHMAVDRPWERPNPNVQRDITRYDTTAEPAGSRQQSRLGNRSNTRQSSYAPSRPDHTTQKPSTPQYHNIIRTNSDNLTQEYPDENRQYVYSLQEWSDRAQRNDPYERIGSIRQDGRVHEQYTPTNEYPEQMYEEEQQQGGEWLGAP